MSGHDPEVETTAIPGLLVVHLPVHEDNRGWFKENWQRRKAVAAGVPDFEPVQNNISFNGSRGTTRGIHAEPWNKYVSVARGRIFGAWVDLRRGESFGRLVTREIGPESAVYVPRGVGNAFQTLEDGTAYTYLVDDHWSVDNQIEYRFLNLADETVAIDWPIPLNDVELSEKDVNHPRLGAVDPFVPAPLLVVGANGQLGRAMVEVLEARAVPYRAVGRDELDLSDPDAWADDIRRGSGLRRYRAVINAAAYTAVDDAETPAGRSAAWAVNSTGVTALAAAAGAAGVPLLHVSTDYVFDGTLPLEQAYSVDFPVAPLSVYGQSKAAGEAAARSVHRHWLVRTSWVIGRGPNFVRTMAHLAAQDVDPRVVDDQVGRLTFAEDLAEGILHLVDSAAPFGTYHLTGSGKPASWATIARWVFEAVGADPDRIIPVSTTEYVGGRTGVAPRPANSTLDLSRICTTGFTPRDHRETVMARAWPRSAE